MGLLRIVSFIFIASILLIGGDIFPLDTADAKGGKGKTSQQIKGKAAGTGKAKTSVSKSGRTAQGAGAKGISGKAKKKGKSQGGTNQGTKKTTTSKNKKLIEKLNKDRQGKIPNSIKTPHEPAKQDKDNRATMGKSRIQSRASLPSKSSKAALGKSPEAGISKQSVRSAFAAGKSKVRAGLHKAPASLKNIFKVNPVKQVGTRLHGKNRKAVHPRAGSSISRKFQATGPPKGKANAPFTQFKGRVGQAWKAAKNWASKNSEARTSKTIQKASKVKVDPSKHPKTLNVKLANRDIKLEADPNRTTTVLGRYDGGTKKVFRALAMKGARIPKNFDFGPKKGGYNLLNTPKAAFKNQMQHFKEYNKPFLDQAIKRGDKIVTTHDPTIRENLFDKVKKNETRLTTYGLEVRYLEQKGFRYDHQSASFIKD